MDTSNSLGSLAAPGEAFTLLEADAGEAWGSAEELMKRGSNNAVFLHCSMLKEEPPLAASTAM